jgi:hypothetical protein
MSKHLVKVEKERVDFIFFDVPLTEVVLELNKLIIKYGESVSLFERYDEHNFDNSTYYCVYVEEQESDEVYQQRIKDIKDNIKFQELKELKRLQEKYLT